MRPQGPRIIAGAWRGRVLQAPPGMATRPTSIRARQALFDMLASRRVVEGARVLDGFAGSGALGLEALSRGALEATFMERDAAALAALARNIAALGAGGRSRVVAGDVLAAPMGPAQGLVFLDPPYGKDLLAPSLRVLRHGGWIGPGSFVVAEIGRLDSLPSDVPILIHRVHGAAVIVAWREGV